MAERWAIRHFRRYALEPSNDCRDWPFAKQWPGGYGVLRVNGGLRRVHVLVCELWHGPRPDGAEAAHLCGRPSCWAGEHLAWKTPVENAKDKELHGTDPRGERNGHHKLTEQHVQEIRIRKASGESYAALSHAFGVTPATLCDAVKRRTWRHV